MHDLLTQVTYSFTITCGVHERVPWHISNLIHNLESSTEEEHILLSTAAL